MSKEGKMEKSFLNFKATHPEWQPSDPSGSLYLSRMADLTTAGIGRRRFLRRSGDMTSGMESVILQPERKLDVSADNERTLMQSQMAKRRGGVLAQSRLGLPGSPSSIFQSNVGLGMA